MDKYTEISLLYDFYGGLLTNRQREVMALYHDENFSLSEIAGELGISRQGVHDALKNAEASLTGYEAKLQLVSKFQTSNKAIREIDQLIERLMEDADKETVTGLAEIKSIIDGLNQ